MVWSDGVRPLSGMPIQIIEGAKCNNDAAYSVYSKFTRAVSSQKSGEYRGGIWDCNPVKVTVPNEPLCMDTSNKIFSLEEMLACDDEQSTEMKDELSINTQLETEVSPDISFSDVNCEVNNKRWLSEEFEKISPPSNANETTRKKPKKTVSFSEVVIDLEKLYKQASMENNLRVSIDDENDLQESVVKDNAGMKNSPISVSPDLNYVFIKMQDEGNALDKKSVAKESTRIKNSTKLKCRLDSPDQQHTEPKHSEIKSSTKISKRRLKQKEKSTVDIREHEMKTKKSLSNRITNEELVNRSRLESAIPELCFLSEPKMIEAFSRPLKNTSVADEPRSSKNISGTDEHKSLKKNVSAANDLTCTRNIALESKKAKKITSMESADVYMESDLSEKEEMPQNSQEIAKSVANDLAGIRNVGLELKNAKKSTAKESTDVHTESDLSEKEKSKNSQEFASKEGESIDDRLKSVLSDVFEDSDMAEIYTNKLKALAEKKKNEKLKTQKFSDDMQMDVVSLPRNNESPESKAIKKHTSNGDKSQYESENSTLSKVTKVCCPPECEKPSCNLKRFQKTEKGVAEDIKVRSNVDESDDKYEKVFPTAELKKNTDKLVMDSSGDSSSNWRKQCIDIRSNVDKHERVSPTIQGEKNVHNFEPNSRSDSCVNWRSQCVDVRRKENTISPRPASDYWRPTNSVNKLDKASSSRKNQSNKIDTSTIEYENTDIVVVPFNLKEPPDPKSRFKVKNADPESIWDEPEQKSRPSREIQPQPKVDWFEVKSSFEAQQSHAQKNRTPSVPRFFDNPTRTFTPTKPQIESREDPKYKSTGRMSASPRLSENCRSRSQSRQENFVHHRSGGRNRSASEHWRSHLAATSLPRDVFYVVKITNHQDQSVEKLKILKEDFFQEVRENPKLSAIIPSLGYSAKQVASSASAMTVLLRCIFSPSYKIPCWVTALEAFVLARRLGVSNLVQECEAYFTNYPIPSAQIQQVIECAQHLHIVEALKSSRFFQKIQNFNSFSDRNTYSPQSCSVSCSVLVDPSEFLIPILSEVSRSLESCNQRDLKNIVIFKSLARVTYLTGVQLKFLTEDAHPQLHVICEVFLNQEKLFSDDMDIKPNSSYKITFEDEVSVKMSEQVEISIVVEDVLLKICPQLSDNEPIILSGRFRASFESSKTENNRKLFCIEKLFYSCLH